jgi:hypothetical protein
MVNHKVNIVSINLFVGAVIISAICLNNFFVFVAKYQVNSRPKLPRLFRARNISGEKNLFFLLKCIFPVVIEHFKSCQFLFLSLKIPSGKRDKNKWLFVALYNFDVY